MKAVLVLVVIILIFALIFGGMYVGRRNQMAVKREAVNAAWSQVDVVLQRRADLIPNLVETVKGFAVHEEQVFGEIARARSALIGAQTPADNIAANTQVTSALNRLLAISENYPQLKSNENFLRLQDELAGTENRIAVERKRYNDAIQDYNTSLFFPTVSSPVWPASPATTPTSRRTKALARPPKSISTSTSRRLRPLTRLPHPPDHESAENMYMRRARITHLPLGVSLRSYRGLRSVSFLP